MRILVTAFPGLGHLHPLVPLALAARSAGHDVRLGIGADLVGWAQRCGLDAWPVGLTAHAAHVLAEREHPGPARTQHLFTDVCVPAALPDLLALASTWRPELVLHEEAEYAGVLLAALLDIGCVTQSWSSPARPAASRQVQTRLLAPVWDRYLPGSPPRREGQLYLDACPAPFQTDDLAGIARTTRVEAVGPALFDGPPAPAPDWLADLPRPAAYLTLGTVDVFSTPATLAHAASALSPGFASVVVSTGPNPVGSLGAPPPHVRAVQYLPQSLVTSRSPSSCPRSTSWSPTGAPAARWRRSRAACRTSSWPGTATASAPPPRLSSASGRASRWHRTSGPPPASPRPPADWSPSRVSPPPPAGPATSSPGVRVRRRRSRCSSPTSPAELPSQPTLGRRWVRDDGGMAETGGRKLVASNRKARHDYTIEDTLEAGLVLTGTEVKSLRAGRASLVDGYATVIDGEIYLQSVHIPEYTQGTWTNHPARRSRKLLLHRQQIDKIDSRVRESGLTLVPLSLYFRDGRAKVEIGIARGKRTYDKRQALRERQDKRDVERAMSTARRGQR